MMHYSILNNIQNNQKEFHSLYHNNLYLYQNYHYEYLIGAIIYNVDFAPNEELELVVQYNYKLNSNSYRSSQNFRYFLTPAKYWQDFGGIEINLHLNKDYSILKYSSLDFKKIDKLTYQYVSDELPDKELIITTEYPWLKKYFSNPFNRILGIFIAVALTIIIIVVIIVVAMIKKNKKIVKKSYQLKSKKFQLLPFLIISGFLLLSLLRTFLYRAEVGHWFVMLDRPFWNSNYISLLFFPIVVMVFIAIITRKGNGNFFKGLLGVFAILSAICLAILGLVFHSSSRIIEGFFVNVPIGYIKIFGRSFHLLISIFLIAFANAVIKEPKKSKTIGFYVFTILAVVSILILTRLDIVFLPVILKTNEVQFANMNFIEILQRIGERCYGEDYSLLLDFVFSIFCTALPLALYYYAYPRSYDK